MEYLSQRGVPFQPRDVREDPTALEELRSLGFRTTPIVVIGDDKLIGFNPKKIDELLKRYES